MNRKLAKAGFVERDFHTGDVTLNYVTGPASGPPLVFIHGQSVTWEEYTFIMPLLAGRFQVLAVTLRGHGKSSWTPDDYSFNQLGEDMRRFLEQVVGRPAVVVGNSSGGVLTAWLAANVPERVRAIVLEDPPLFRCDWPNIKVHDLERHAGRVWQDRLVGDHHRPARDQQRARTQRPIPHRERALARAPRGG